MSAKNWFYSKGLKPQGPVGVEEIRQKIMVGDIGPWDLVSCDEEGKGAGEWKAACQWKVFEERLFPAFQMGQISVSENDPQWVVLKQTVGGQPIQEGPYTTEDLKLKVRAQEIAMDHYVWKTGLSGWCRVRDRSDLV